jgi:polysaccharide biosynthesis/export protein
MPSATQRTAWRTSLIRRGRHVCASLVALAFLLQMVAGAPAAPAAPGPRGPSPAVQPPPDYILGPGDQVDVTVFGEPDLTTTAAVRPDGMITLPLIKEVRAAGETVAQLQNDLTRRYAVYLRHPTVSVAVKQFQMDHIYVMGEVVKPGRYDLTNNMTVLDAITLAGGSTVDANLDATHIARHDGTKDRTIPVKVKQLIQGKSAAQNVALQNGDLVYIPRRGLNLLDILRFIGVIRGAAGY